MVGVNRRRRVTIDRQDWIRQMNFKFSIFNYFSHLFKINLHSGRSEEEEDNCFSLIGFLAGKIGLVKSILDF